MDLAPDIAELALDRRVHVLVGLEVAGGILGDLGQTAFGLCELVIGQQTRGMQPLRVLHCRLAVVREELGVVDAQKLPDRRLQGPLDPARPQTHARTLPLTPGQRSTAHLPIAGLCLG